MSMRYLGGFITASYNPLKVPNAPTIGTVTAGVGQVSVTFTAPSNVGGGAITSYQVLVRDSSTGATFTGTGSASPIVVTGLTAGQTYTAQVAAINTYGPSAYSASSGSFVPLAPPKLFSWGNNSSGQLGQNDTYKRSSPVQVGALTDWSRLSGGNGMCVAVKTDGTLWSWGSGGSGRTGQNNTTTLSSPVQVGALTDWSQVSAGGDAFCVAIKTNNTLWAWGSSSYGQLGQNNIVTLSSPVQVGALTDWSQVSAGGYLCAAIKTNGTLWAWGRNDVGQLGQDNRVNRSSPVQIGALTDWSQVSAGADFCAAVKTNGTLWTWGTNQYSQLGLNVGYGIRRSSPVQVGALTDWSQVSAGYNFCTAIKTNGTIWSWGSNNQGQLGLNIATTIKRSSPVQVGALTDWSQISAGSGICLAIKTNKSLWSWGGNDEGQLGQNDTIRRSSPVQVGALTTWTSIGQGSSRQFSIATSS